MPEESIKFKDVIKLLMSFVDSIHDSIERKLLREV